MASTIPCHRSTLSEHNSAKAKHGLPYMYLVMVLPSPTTDVPSILYQTSAINLPYSNMALFYSTADLPPLPQICSLTVFLDHTFAKPSMAYHTRTWRWFCFTLPRICLPLLWIYPVWFCHTLLLVLPCFAWTSQSLQPPLQVFWNASATRPTTHSSIHILWLECLPQQAAASSALYWFANELNGGYRDCSFVQFLVSCLQDWSPTNLVGANMWQSIFQLVHTQLWCYLPVLIVRI